jgi:hypothetical protein
VEVESVAGAGKEFEEMGAVGDIQVDGLAIVAAGGNMIDRARELDSPGAGHGIILAGSGNPCQGNSELSGFDPDLHGRQRW